MIINWFWNGLVNNRLLVIGTRKCVFVIKVLFPRAKHYFINTNNTEKHLNNLFTLHSCSLWSSTIKMKKKGAEWLKLFDSKKHFCLIAFIDLKCFCSRDGKYYKIWRRFMILTSLCMPLWLLSHCWICISLCRFKAKWLYTWFHCPSGLRQA